MLGDIVRVMSDVPDMRLRIEGHTDAQGDETANQALSERRAKAVRDYLVSKGVDASRLEAIGYGGTKPIDTNRTERGREANRRIEFQIL
jgi:outer membrane protein OmpA-like peptidoglycan-associated protein